MENYRCFKDLAVDFHKRLTVVVGSNGAGKTTILDGVAVALHTATLPALQRWNPSELATKDIKLRANGGYEDSATVSSDLTILGDAYIQDLEIKPNFEADEETASTNQGRKVNQKLVSLHSDITSDPQTPEQLPVFAYYRSTRNLQSVAVALLAHAGGMYDNTLSKIKMAREESCNSARCVASAACSR